MTDESEHQVPYLLTKKVDELTENQMKEMTTQRMEDSMTIKILERDLESKKQTFLFTKKKLLEVRSKGAAQTATLNNLERAYKAMVEKYKELKKFQTEVILINVNNSEHTHAEFKNKKDELLKILQIMIEKLSYLERLQNNMFDKRKKFEYVQRQFNERKSIFNRLSEILNQLLKNVTILETESSNETSDNAKRLLEEKDKKTKTLISSQETFKKKIEQEINEWSKTKNNLSLDTNSRQKSMAEKKELFSKLRSELSTAENKRNELSKIYEKDVAQKTETEKELARKRQINESSKNVFDENVSNIESEQNKIDSQLQDANNKFTQNEADLRIEFDTLFAKLKERKELLLKLENYRQNSNKQDQTKSLLLQKRLSAKKELQSKLKALTDESKKQEKIKSSRNAKVIEMNSIVHELQDKNNNIKRKLESAVANQINLSNSFANRPDEINSRTHMTSNKGSRQEMLKDGPVSSTATLDTLSGSDKKVVQTPKKYESFQDEIRKSLFGFDNSDDDTVPENSAGSVDRRKVDQVRENVEEKENYREYSTSSKLFDDILSQKSEESSRSYKDADGFKVPASYMSTYRKKSTGAKKFFKI